MNPPKPDYDARAGIVLKRGEHFELKLVRTLNYRPPDFAFQLRPRNGKTGLNQPVGAFITSDPDLATLTAMIDGLKRQRRRLRKGG